MRGLSLAGVLAMAAGVVGLWKTGIPLAPSSAAIALQAVAAVLFVRARATFGRRSFHPAAIATEGGLVTTGPYRWTRHPIDAAILLFAGAGAAARPSAGSLFFVLVAAGAAVRIVAEETLVVERYPEYREYARQTKRLVPFCF